MYYIQYERTKYWSRYHLYDSDGHHIAARSSRTELEAIKAELEKEGQ